MSAELENWAKKYEDLTNSDDTIGAMAKYYTCTFMFDMEKAKVIIEMHDGKVKNINTNLKRWEVYAFNCILNKLRLNWPMQGYLYAIPNLRNSYRCW